MVSCWHLLWIVPLAASFGAVTAAILAANKDEEAQKWQKDGSMDPAAPNR